MWEYLPTTPKKTTGNNKQPYLVCVNELANRDVDYRFVEDDHLRIFINVKALLRLGNVTHHFQELPVSQIGNIPVPPLKIPIILPVTIFNKWLLNSPELAVHVRDVVIQSTQVCRVPVKGFVCRTVLQDSGNGTKGSSLIWQKNWTYPKLHHIKSIRSHDSRVHVAVVYQVTYNLTAQINHTHTQIYNAKTGNYVYRETQKHQLLLTKPHKIHIHPSLLMEINPFSC